TNGGGAAVTATASCGETRRAGLDAGAPLAVTRPATMRRWASSTWSASPRRTSSESRRRRGTVDHSVLGPDFFAAVFLAAVFFAPVFFAVAFLAAVFFAAVFFAAVFLAAGFLSALSTTAAVISSPSWPTRPC